MTLQMDPPVAIQATTCAACGATSNQQYDHDGRLIETYAYTRLSNDPEGRRADHTTQKRLTCEACDRLGWPHPTRWFHDNDTSASKAEIIRDDFENLMRHVFSRPRAVAPYVVGWTQDRFQRQIGDLDKIGDTIEAKSGRFGTWKEGEINIRRGSRAQFYIQGVLAAHEAQTIGVRTLAGIETAALAGKAHGKIRYGWDRIFDGPTVRGRPSGRDVINLHQARIVVRLARRHLAGHSLRSLYTELNAAGEPTPNQVMAARLGRPIPDEQWNSQTIRSLLRREANIGIRVWTHKGQTQRVKGQWPAIMREKLFRNVNAVLDDPSRKTTQSNIVKHEVSGIATCGVCGAPVTGRNERAKSRIDPRVYTCPTGGRCVVRAMAPVNAIVFDALVGVFTDQALRALFTVDASEEMQETIDAIEAQNDKIRTYEVQIDADELPADSGARLIAMAAKKVKELEALLSTQTSEPVIGDALRVPLTEFEAWLEDLRATNLGGYRSLVAAVLEVKILPAKKGRRPKGVAFDASSVQVRVKRAA